jgi:hypothetical protein
MAMIIRAHYDGKNIVPDEPVDLPLNQPIELEVKQEPRFLPWDPGKAAEAWESLKTMGVSGANIPDEALRRENMYWDQGL